MVAVMDDSIVIGTFKGGYDRKGKVVVTHAVCCICTKTKECIGVDNSEEEYNYGYICFDCIADNNPQGR